MFRCSIPLFLTLALPAQESPAAKPAETAPQSPRVEVPVFPNATCPIMGKKVSMPLSVDTELGRIWVCCKPCYKKVLRDVAAAHKTAYPTVEAHANTTCPVSGEPIGEHAVEVTLQGHRFRVCCIACTADAQKQSQRTLARVLQPKLVDVGNTTCPVTGQPVADNVVVTIGDHLVRLATPLVIDDVQKDPAGVLAKAQEIRKKQPAPAPHVHTKTAEPAPKTAPAPGTEGGK